MTEYRWENPWDWLNWKVVEQDYDYQDLWNMFRGFIDNDMIQEMCQSDMDEDGYFENQKEHPCDCPKCGEEFEDDESEETHIDDHGMCWSCFAEWKNGE